MKTILLVVSLFFTYFATKRKTFHSFARMKVVFFPLLVCSPGFSEDGNTCLPCLQLISGSGGENLTDGDTEICSPVPFQNKREFHQYLLDIKDNCVKNQK